MDVLLILLMLWWKWQRYLVCLWCINLSLYTCIRETLYELCNLKNHYWNTHSTRKIIPTQFNFLVFRWFIWLYEILICLLFSIQKYFLLVRTSLLSFEQFLHWVVLFCPSESPLPSLWPWGSYSTCFFMNHLGKFPRLLKHSQEAQEMLKRDGKKKYWG